MSSKHNKPDYSDIVEYESGGDRAHHHRGKSSEDLVDKIAIVANLGIRSGQIVLDAGCGNGYITKEFLKLVGAGGKVFALDVDEIAIAELRRESAGTSIEALVADISRETPLTESSFDLVYLATVFHGFSADQVRGFEREVCRILKPGGRLAIVEIVKRVTPFGPPLPMRYSPEELQQALNLLPLATVGVGEYFYLQLFENRVTGLTGSAPAASGLV
ncbi:MAG: class I SAM-dependent methyltransferase [Geobacteraceae bacterium]|nr:class I SAM-dependent methyltransferase [Geobacteraceae bacterium]